MLRFNRSVWRITPDERWTYDDGLQGWTFDDGLQERRNLGSVILEICFQVLSYFSDVGQGGNPAVGKWCWCHGAHLCFGLDTRTDPDFGLIAASGASKDTVVVTPLMEYVRLRRAAKSAPQV